MYQCNQTSVSNHRRVSIALWLLIVLLPLGALAQESPPPLPDTTAAVPDSEIVVVAPPTAVMAEDFKYDDGNSLKLRWIPSIDDQPLGGKVVAYRIFRSTNNGPFDSLAQVPLQSTDYYDQNLHHDSTYQYRVAALSRDYVSESVATEPISPEREWINFDRKWLFLLALIIGGAVIYFIQAARAGKDLFIRRIAGLEAVDEAIGRATEMGRPILFIPGILDMDDVQTLAAITILGRVARQIAEYDTKIRMPVSRSLVMTAARETIKASYQTAGHPDAYNDDMVQYVTDEQFGYVAAVDGIMVREKPATVFLLGAFFAESLILAETGNSVGAIQIAGTARPAQLPFFIAACDFTLIGEELFAASAYLSGEPKALGSLKGQDVGKGIALIAILVGVVAITVAQAWNVEFMQEVYDWLTSVFTTSP